MSLLQRHRVLKRQWYPMHRVVNVIAISTSIVSMRSLSDGGTADLKVATYVVLPENGLHHLKILPGNCGPYLEIRLTFSGRVPDFQVEFSGGGAQFQVASLIYVGWNKYYYFENNCIFPVGSLLLLGARYSAQC